MTYKRISIANFDPDKFILGVAMQYGHDEAVYVGASWLRLQDVASQKHWLKELKSPRYVVRIKLHPTKGHLIVETINDKLKGYHYEATPTNAFRRERKYDRR